jgi:hypothetical protein
VPQSHDSGKLPPCHQHHGPKQSTAVKPCIDAVAATDGSSPSLSLERYSLELLVTVSGVGSDQPLPTVTMHALHAASPPILVEDSSPLILRI